MEKIIGIESRNYKSMRCGNRGRRSCGHPECRGGRTTPSVVFLHRGRANGSSGRRQKRQAVTNPDNTVMSIKRYMGRDHSVTLNGKEILAAGNFGHDPSEDETGSRKLPRPKSHAGGYHRSGVLRGQPAAGHQGRGQDRGPRSHAHHQRTDRCGSGIRHRQG